MRKVIKHAILAHMFDQVKIVLVNPSHPGNIGATARAMKNMGLTELCLVDPVVFPSPEADARASGADDILANAKVVSTLGEALADCEQVFGTSARSRTLPWPLLNPRECAQQALTKSKAKQAFVFGRERTGLTNEELALCHFHIHIPTNPDFSSLNLAAAVQVMCYELRISYLQAADVPVEPTVKTAVKDAEDQPATHAETQGLVDHLLETMTQVQFLSPAHPRKLMQRMHRLFMRANLKQTEVNILRGFLSAVNKRR